VLDEPRNPNPFYHNIAINTVGHLEKLPYSQQAKLGSLMALLPILNKLELIEVASTITCDEDPQH
jgi:hypothetical protein